LGLPYPRARIINHPSRASEAARDLRFPVIVKANIGGSGAGIVRYDSPASLERAIEAGTIDLGIDQTALVQEYVPARGGHITRVETLGGKYLYGIKVFTSGESFNLCPADICQTTDGVELARTACPLDAPKTGLQVEACTPPDEVIEAVERIARAAEIDVGGIEYIVDDRDGSLLYYDINALSNFVADAPRVVGFDPHARLADFLEEEASKCATVTGYQFSAVG
jgi:glutathione synthase/RimK-type ligase-like ATP-grasp enzyme